MPDNQHQLKHRVKVLCTGGTIDKVYFDALSEFQIGNPVVNNILKEALAQFSYEVESILKKDSLEITDEDRDMIFNHVAGDSYENILITHGTDTMINTAQRLEEIKDKTIVLTGAMQPARFRNTDAIFNIGYSIAATQHLPHGIYLAMNGQIFTPDAVQKNRAAAQFEAT